MRSLIVGALLLTLAVGATAAVRVDFESTGGYELATDGGGTLALSTDQSYSASHSAKIELADSWTQFAKVRIPCDEPLATTNGVFWTYIPVGSPTGLAPYMYYGVDSNQNGLFDFTGGSSGDSFVIAFVTGGEPYQQNWWFMTGMNGATKVHVVGNRTGIADGTFSSSGTQGTLDELRALTYSGATEWGDLAIREARVGAGEWPGAGAYTAYVDDAKLYQTSSVLASGSLRLVETQNPDGGWGWPLTGASASNTVGPIAMGLCKAYRATGDPSVLAAIEQASSYLLAKNNTFSPSDGYLAAELDSVLGGAAHRDFVKANFYDKLEAGTYNRNNEGTLYSTDTYIDRIRTVRSGSQANMAAWDIGVGLVGAAACGVAGTELDKWIAGTEAEVNELDGDNYYDVIGLAGALYGLAYAGVTFDPSAGEHESASSLADLAAILASYQIPASGGLAWNSNYVISYDGDEAVQETAYAVLALGEFGTTYSSEISAAIEYLCGVQLATGGWMNYNYAGTTATENNEITGEALWAITSSSSSSLENLLSLDPTTASLYLKPGETCVINMNVANLQQEVKACQAMLSFSSTYFKSGSSDVAIAPGGGAWDELIYGTWTTDGDIDTCVGVKGNSTVGTKADGTVAKITLTAQAEGTTQIVFRPDADPDPYLVGSTFLADMSASPVWPTKQDSADIVIDGTAPSGTITINSGAACTSDADVTLTLAASDALAGVEEMRFSNDGAAWSSWEAYGTTKSWTLDSADGLKTVYVEYKDKAGNVGQFTDTITLDTGAPSISITSHPDDPVLRGPHAIVVTASDATAGLAGVPAVTVSGMAVSAAVAGPAGTWTYYVLVDAWTANGTHTIDASVSDLAGNSNSATESFVVNKNQVTCAVTLQGFVGASRSVAFSVNSAAPFTETLAFDATGTAFYTLTDLPDGDFTVSAKTDWNLRQRLSGSYTAPTAGSITVLPDQANDGTAAAARGLNDAPTGWGTGSWKANGTVKSTMSLTSEQLFGRSDVTISELKSITYWTKKGTTHTVSPYDWYLNIYTNPYTGQPWVGKWYGGRFGCEPYFSENIQETAGSWNQWQTAAGTPNRLRFFDSTMNTYFGSYTDGFLSDLTSNANYAGQVIMRIDVSTGSGWAAGFTGQVDGLDVELYDGTVARVDFEAIDGPSFMLRGGDLDGSNSVNILDYTRMKSSWGAGGVGDIDGNGFTGTVDYGWMKANWFTVGDPL